MKLRTLLKRGEFTSENLLGSSSYRNRLEVRVAFFFTWRIVQILQVSSVSSQALRSFPSWKNILKWSFPFKRRFPIRRNFLRNSSVETLHRNSTETLHSKLLKSPTLRLTAKQELSIGNQQSLLKQFSMKTRPFACHGEGSLIRGCCMRRVGCV